MASNSCRQTGDNFGCSLGEVVNVVLLMSSVIFFIFLILKDAVKGLKSKSHWIPGDFLVLSALTIQLLNLISTQGEPLSWDKNNEISLNAFWLIHTSRILLCVVIGYLMPAMANPGSEDFWGKVLALALTVFLHVISELYIIIPASPDLATSYLSRLWPKQKGTSWDLYITLAALILSSFVTLILLLGCANIAGRGVERIVAQKVPLILKGQVEDDDHHHHHHHQSYEAVSRTKEAEENHGYSPHCQDCWRRVEDAVLRAWILSRAYSLEYVIARSVLASSVATVVTFQIALTIVAGAWNSGKLDLHTRSDRLRFTITMLQCVFIVIGWAMIGWRWITAVVYYGSWSGCLRIEDFWTRHLRELQQAKEKELPQSKLLHAKIGNLVANQPTKLTPPGRLLYAVIGLQWLTVAFSKACWLASLVVFHNKLTGKLRSLILSKLEKDYEKYKRILEGVQMLGETPKSLWLSNRKSIRIAKALIQNGKEDGENCQHLVDFLATKRTVRGLGLSCLEPNKPQTGLKFLCKGTPIEGTHQSQEDQFTDTSAKPWKMAAVSLLGIIVQLYPICARIEKERASTSGFFPLIEKERAVKDCLKAYSQAWEIIDFVSETDREVDRITSEAADKYLDTLETKVHEELSPGSSSSQETPPESVSEALAKLKKKNKRKMETPGSVNAHDLKSKEKTEESPNRWKGNDSIDWKAEALGSAVYKLCNSIDCNERSDVNELLKELESSLADIINECLQKVQHFFLVKSRKWAVKGDERRIAKALYTTGKASEIMKKLASRPKVLMEERSELAVVPYPE